MLDLSGHHDCYLSFHALSLLASRPELEAEIGLQVRQEQARVRPDPKAKITGEVLYRMTYARQVVKEVLRYRPPAPMVPQIVQKPFRLTEDYVAPKGTLLMPSIHASCLQVPCFSLCCHRPCSIAFRHLQIFPDISQYHALLVCVISFSHDVSIAQQQSVDHSEPAYYEVCIRNFRLRCKTCIPWNLWTVSYQLARASVGEVVIPLVACE